MPLLIHNSIIASVIISSAFILYLLLIARIPKYISLDSECVSYRRYTSCSFSTDLLLLLIAYGLLLIHIPLTFSYTLYGKDIHFEYWALVKVLLTGHIDLATKNVFTTALYDSVLIPVVSIISNVYPCVIYKSLYPLLVMLRIIPVYLSLKYFYNHSYKFAVVIALVYISLTPFDIFFSSLRLGVAIYVYLTIIYMLVVFLNEGGDVSKRSLILLLTTISVILGYYTIGIVLIITMLSLSVVFVLVSMKSRFVKDQPRMTALFCITLASAISLFVYILYQAIETEIHIFNTLNTLLNYQAAITRRVTYISLVSSEKYLIKRLITYVPYVINLAGILVMLARTIRLLSKNRNKLNNNYVVVYVWLTLSFIIVSATVLLRTGFEYILIISSVYLALGMCTLFVEVKKMLRCYRVAYSVVILLIALTLLLTQFISSTRVLDTYLGLETSSPALSSSSLYRGISSVELQDYFMIWYLLKHLPKNALSVNIYCDEKIYNAFVSIAADMSMRTGSILNLSSLNIDFWALRSIFYNFGLHKGLLVLSYYNLRTNRFFIADNIIIFNIQNSRIIKELDVVYYGGGMVLMKVS